jgi:hypothetical protein
MHKFLQQFAKIAIHFYILDKIVILIIFLTTTCYAVTIPPKPSPLIFRGSARTWPGQIVRRKVDFFQ